MICEVYLSKAGMEAAFSEKLTKKSKVNYWPTKHRLLMVELLFAQEDYKPLHSPRLF